MIKILFGIITLCVMLSFTIDNGKPPAENVKLSGVITYRDYYASAKQADAGAEIYAVSETELRSTKYKSLEETMGNFQYSKSNFFLSANTLIDPAKIKKAQDYFDDASDLTCKFLSGFRQLPAVSRTVADATGNYTFNMKPGRYHVLVISRSVKSNNIAESKGNLEYRIVDVKSSGETFLDVDFIRHERVIPFAPVPAGC
jgi:hypothetical protein